MQTDPLLLGLRTAIAWGLRGVLDVSRVAVAGVVVTARTGDGRESMLIGEVARAGEDLDPVLADAWDALVARLSSLVPFEPAALVGHLAGHPVFAGTRTTAVTALNAPPLAAFLILSGHLDGAPPEVSVPVLLAIRRQLQSALASYLMCAQAGAHGHELAFLGISDPFLRLHEEIRSAASHADMPVLVTGERGSGKEAVAYAIHHHSTRLKGPFVVVNSAALHPDLYAAELFGCRRGAYTGATEDRRGRFEAAEGGTLFFDEITEMPPHLYAGLLRAFDHGEIQKLGENRRIRANVRLIAATNRNLDALVSEGRFPADLYDRIGALRIAVPALRERKTDVPLLASYFLRRYCQAPGGDGRVPPDSACKACRLANLAPCLHPAVARALTDHSWPGNVRELKNVIARLRVVSRDGRITPECLPPALRCDGPAPHGEADDTLETAIRRHILKTLQGARWNKSAAARALGIPLSTLVSKMKRFSIQGHPPC